MVEGFTPPPYPYDRLEPLKALAAAHEGGSVDLSIGTPCDPPTSAVIAALAASGAEAGYPPSLGTSAFREAASDWLLRRFGVDIPALALAACVGTKELVASVPHLLRLRDPSRDTVLYPAVSYPTYAMGAQLGGCRAVPVPLGEDWHLDLSAVSATDAARALLLWVNEPGNPTGSQSASGAPAEAAATAAWNDDAHVEVQRARYAERRRYARARLADAGLVDAGGPSSFYLWARSADPTEDGWAVTARLAGTGTLVAAGDLYGEGGAAFVRIALVEPLERLELAFDRIAAAHRPTVPTGGSQA